MSFSCTPAFDIILRKKFGIFIEGKSIGWYPIIRVPWFIILPLRVAVSWNGWKSKKKKEFCLVSVENKENTLKSIVSNCQLKIWIMLFVIQVAKIKVYLCKAVWLIWKTLNYYKTNIILLAHKKRDIILNFTLYSRSKRKSRIFYCNLKL